MATAPPYTARPSQTGARPVSSGVAHERRARLEARSEHAALIQRPANDHLFEVVPNTVPVDGRNRWAIRLCRLPIGVAGKA